MHPIFLKNNISQLKNFPQRRLELTNALDVERIGSDSNLGLRITGGLTFGPKPGAIDKG